MPSESIPQNGQNSVGEDVAVVFDAGDDAFVVSKPNTVKESDNTTTTTEPAEVGDDVSVFTNPNAADESGSTTTTTEPAEVGDDVSVFTNPNAADEEEPDYGPEPDHGDTLTPDGTSGTVPITTTMVKPTTTTTKPSNPVGEVGITDDTSVVLNPNTIDESHSDEHVEVPSSLPHTGESTVGPEAVIGGGMLAIGAAAMAAKRVIKGHKNK